MRADKFTLTSALMLLLLQSTSYAVANTSEEDQSYLQPVISSGVTTLGSIEKMQGENMLLEMKVKTAQLKRQLKENGQNPDGSDIKVIPVQKEENSDVDATKVVAHVEAPKPQVTEISGQGKKLIAVLTFPDGKQVEVSAGQRLPGSALVVTNIMPTKIQLSDGSYMGL